MRPSRAIFLAASAAIALGGVTLACTAGDPIDYVSANDGGGEGAAGEGGGADVATRDAPDQPDSTFPQLAPSSLNSCGASVTVDASIDGGPAPCDLTAGEGCCFDGTGTCYQTWEVFSDAGMKCHGGGFFFQACAQDTPDSPCCWGHGAAGDVFTRYAADCASGPHACDPLAAGGGSCVDGTPCTSITCHGATVGYCGNGPSPCND